MQQTDAARHIGQNIRKHRMLQDMTQRELAEKIGVSKGAVSYYERFGNVNRKLIQKIAFALDITSDVLSNVADIAPKENQAHIIAVQRQTIEQLQSKVASLKDTIAKQWELLHLLVHKG